MSAPSKLPRSPSPVARRFAAPFAALVSFLALAGALPATAGKAVIASGGETQTLEYEGNDLLRMNISGDNYMLVRDNNLYSVMGGDNPMVFDASSMLKGMSGLIKEFASSPMTASVVSIEKTGRSETVAGIRGDVYLLTVEEDGKEQTQEMVLSDDPRVIELQSAFMTFSSVAMDALDDAELREQSQDMATRLKEMDLGALRVGDDMVITELSNETIPDARFELPAEPTDMQGFGAILDAMGESSDQQGSADGETSGGLFSGMMEALGGKADRQAERQTDRTEREVDRATDNAVDKAVDKVFGKLFGD